MTPPAAGLQVASEVALKSFDTGLVRAQPDGPWSFLGEKCRVSNRRYCRAGLTSSLVELTARLRACLAESSAVLRYKKNKDVETHLQRRPAGVAWPETTEGDETQGLSTFC